ESRLSESDLDCGPLKGPSSYHRSTGGPDGDDAGRGLCRWVRAVPTPRFRPGPREGTVVSRGLAHTAGSDSGLYVRASSILSVVSVIQLLATRDSVQQLLRNPLAAFTHPKVDFVQDNPLHHAQSGSASRPTT